ncbi:MAG: HAD family hydrolase [Arenicellales bacterium]|jgi:HAD superfamily hydrolase (TIGR01490 family)
MSLALFDLDHTLLVGDSDHAWGQFLGERSVVDAHDFTARSDYYLLEYQAGRLDIHEFLDFQLAPLARTPFEELLRLREEYVAEKIRPLVTSEATELVESHRRRGDTLAIITATNDFITRPIAGLFGIEHLIATELEFVNGAFTGRIVGEPCFREGKVGKLRDWMAHSGCDLRGSWFYSDSQNDLPLLERVEHPAAVNPDPVLEREARQRGWPVHHFQPA